MKTLTIAKVVHHAHKAYCEEIGDFSQKSWEDAGESVQNSKLDGIAKFFADEDITPEQMHDSWCEFKRLDGWVYGEEKDVESKTHPCLVEYGELPRKQRVKDDIFIAVIEALSGLREPDGEPD